LPSSIVLIPLSFSRDRCYDLFLSGELMFSALVCMMHKLHPVIRLDFRAHCPEHRKRFFGCLVRLQVIFSCFYCSFLFILTGSGRTLRITIYNVSGVGQLCTHSCLNGLNQYHFAVVACYVCFLKHT
jgi:hypothetical protein